MRQMYRCGPEYLAHSLLPTVLAVYDSGLNPMDFVNQTTLILDWPSCEIGKNLPACVVELHSQIHVVSQDSILIRIHVSSIRKHDHYEVCTSRYQSIIIITEEVTFEPSSLSAGQ